MNLTKVQKNINLNYQSFKKLENGRPISRLFLGLGKALWAIDRNDPTNSPTDGRGANEALIIRFFLKVSIFC